MICTIKQINDGLTRLRLSRFSLWMEEPVVAGETGIKCEQGTQIYHSILVNVLEGFQPKQVIDTINQDETTPR